jgi:phosphoserine phosphatase
MIRNVYDFDGTIYNGNSTKDFFVFSLKRYPVILLIMPKFLFATVMYFFKIYSKTKMKEKFYSFLEYIPNINSDLEIFWEQHIVKINDWYLKQKNISDVIISASPFFLLEPLTKNFSVELIASNVDIKNGIYKGENCYGIEKVERFYNQFPNDTIGKFYSDSFSDNSLAKLAKEAFFVDDCKIIVWPKYKC